MSLTQIAWLDSHNSCLDISPCVQSFLPPSSAMCPSSFFTRTIRVDICALVDFPFFRFTWTRNCQLFFRITMTVIYFYWFIKQLTLDIGRRGSELRSPKTQTKDILAQNKRYSRKQKQKSEIKPSWMLHFDAVRLRRASAGCRGCTSPESRYSTVFVSWWIETCQKKLQ